MRSPRKSAPSPSWSLRWENNKKYDIIFHAKLYPEHRHLLPYDLRQPSEEKLLSWLSHRKAPKNRQFVNQILRSINDDNNPLRYVDISHALSLNDARWITNEKETLRWAAIIIPLTKFYPMSPSQGTARKYPSHALKLNSLRKRRNQCQTHSALWPYAP